MQRDSATAATCKLLVYTSLVLLLVDQVSALSCPPCNKQACPRVRTKCAYGRVLDACGCCMVCGNGPNEACGGEYMMLGQCGKGLECHSNHASNQPEFIEGVCVPKKSWVRRTKLTSSMAPPRRGLPPGLKQVHRSPVVYTKQQQDTAADLHITAKKYPKHLIP